MRDVQDGGAGIIRRPRHEMPRADRRVPESAVVLRKQPQRYQRIHEHLRGARVRAHSRSPCGSGSAIRQRREESSSMAVRIARLS
jgi:hypothetical protein